MSPRTPGRRSRAGSVATAGASRSSRSSSPCPSSRSIVVLATAALRVGLRAWEAGQRRADLQQESRALVELVSEALAGASAYQRPPGQSPERVVLFEGEPEEVRFVTSAPPLTLDAPIAPVSRGRPRTQGPGHAAAHRAARALRRAVRAGARARPVPVGHPLHPRLPGRGRGLAGSVGRPRGGRVCRPRCGSSSPWPASPERRRRSWSRCRWESRRSDASRPVPTGVRERRGGRADRGAPPARAPAHDRRGVRPGDAARGGDGARTSAPSLSETWLAEAAYQRALAEILPEAIDARARPERRARVPPVSDRHARAARASRSPDRPGAAIVPDHRRERADEPQPGSVGTSWTGCSRSSASRRPSGT